MRLIPYVRRTEVPARTWPDVSNLFDGFFHHPFFAAAGSDRWLPAVDILEKDGALVVRAEVPGMDEKDIELKLEGNVLTLKGEKKVENEKEAGQFHRRESFHGSFERSFTLPDTVDRDKIKAEYKNGLLTITIPQRPEVAPREIPVTVQ